MTAVRSVVMSSRMIIIKIRKMMFKIETLRDVSAKIMTMIGITVMSLSTRATKSNDKKT